MPVCHTCKAEIVWATINGKAHPFNATPSPQERGYSIHNGVATHNREPGIYHVTHFATCEFADQHRKPRR